MFNMSLCVCIYSMFLALYKGSLLYSYLLIESFIELIVL